MTIVVLGWGSLVFDEARNESSGLYTRGGWHEGGPILPIEFARKSGGTVDRNMVNRLTLVIDHRGTLLPVYWAEAEEKSLRKARSILKEREGGGRIDYLDMDIGQEDNDHTVSTIHAWAQMRQSAMSRITGVIWTAIPSNIESPLLENVLSFIDLLEDKSEAEDYIRRTPVTIQTKIRKAIERKYGWFPYPKEPETMG